MSTFTPSGIDYIEIQDPAITGWSPESKDDNPGVAQVHTITCWATELRKKKPGVAQIHTPTGWAHENREADHKKFGHHYPLADPNSGGELRTTPGMQDNSRR